MQRSRLALGAAVVSGTIVIALAPVYADLFWLRILSFALMFGALASALNITAGFTGYPAFGDVVWFGLGATVTGVLMAKERWPFAAAVPVASLFCITIAAIVGPSLLRLRGNYFAIGTLALNEATRALVQNLGVTGGPLGLSLPITTGSPESTARFFYYLFLGVLVLTIAISLAVVRTRLGYGLRAIRAGEDAAEALGVRTTLLKTTAWTLSAGLIGLVGSVYAYWITFIEPPAVFDVGISIKMFVVMLLGGVGTLFGPVIGAFGIQLLENEVWGNVLNYHLIILGGIVIGLVVVLPGGILSFGRRRVRDVALLIGRPMAAPAPPP